MIMLKNANSLRKSIGKLISTTGKLSLFAKQDPLIQKKLNGKHDEKLKRIGRNKIVIKEDSLPSIVQEKKRDPLKNQRFPMQILAISGFNQSKLITNNSLSKYRTLVSAKNGRLAQTQKNPNESMKLPLLQDCNESSTQFLKVERKDLQRNCRSAQINRRLVERKAMNESKNFQIKMIKTNSKRLLLERKDGQISLSTQANKLASCIQKKKQSLSTNMKSMEEFLDEWVAKI